MRIRQNVVMWVASLAILFSVVGCVPTDVDMINLHNSVDVMNEKIDEQQAKFTKEIDRAQGHVAIVNDAMKTAQGLEEKAVAGIEASRPFNPYADEMAIALGLITAVTGYAYRSKTKKYSAIKAGVNKTLVHASSNSGKVSADTLYGNIGAARRDKGIS